MNNYKKSSTFCPLPFLSIMIDTQQEFRYCCVAAGPTMYAKIDGKLAKAGVNKLMDSFNSPHMQEIRRKMVNGEKVADCNRCYHTEEVFKQPSFRQTNILDYQNLLGKKKLHQLITDIIKNDFISDETPVYLDLRLGNLCNLQCRMCTPSTSSQIAKEHNELYKTNDQYKLYHNLFIGGGDIDYTKNDGWFNGDFLWDEIESFIPNLKSVYMTGGEPTLVKGNFRFMQKCIELGYNDKIKLAFNTNMTNLNEHFLELVSKFKYVWINASLDGVGKITEYQRYPSNWDMQIKNLKKYIELPNINVTVTPVLTLYNVLQCDEIIDFFHDFSIKHNKNISIDYLNADEIQYDSRNLPKKYRVGVAQRIKEKWLTNEWAQSNIGTKKSINYLISLLESETKENYKFGLSNFLLITSIYDKSRNQNFSETFPELKRIIHETLGI